MQVHLAEPRHHEEEDPRLVHLLYLGLELEVLEDAPHVGREAADVAVEMRGYVVGIPLQALEVKRRTVVEPLVGDDVQPQVQRISVEPVPQARVLLQHSGLGRRQHAVEAPQDSQGQHDPLILRRPVRAAQQIGDLPDQVREVRVIRHHCCPDVDAEDSSMGF